MNQMLQETEVQESQVQQSEAPQTVDPPRPAHPRFAKPQRIAFVQSSGLNELIAWARIAS